MCGRYYVNDTFEKEVRLLIKELHGQFRAESISGTEAFASPEGSDVFPGSSAIILKEGRAGFEAVQMVWGFPNPKGKGTSYQCEDRDGSSKANLFRQYSEAPLHHSGQPVL